MSHDLAAVPYNFVAVARERSVELAAAGTAATVRLAAVAVADDSTGQQSVSAGPIAVLWPPSQMDLNDK